jgi:hypothetical protein
LAQPSQRRIQIGAQLRRVRASSRRQGAHNSGRVERQLIDSSGNLGPQPPADSMPDDAVTHRFTDDKTDDRVRLTQTQSRGRLPAELRYDQLM